VILSDRTIREELSNGRIQVEPFDESLVQPASIDVRLDRYFRVFLNHTMPVIDVKKDLEELTQLVEIGDDEPFVLHPGEFVLGATLERVTLPDDIVGRVEGKSSLGRLGLLIHSSLPASEQLLVRDQAGLRLRTIGEIVKERHPCQVVSFDPDSFEVGYHDVTGFYEGPEDRIYEVRLASGRHVRVTAGHNLFTLDPDGSLRKVRTGELRKGVLVAVPRAVPDPPLVEAAIDILGLVPEHAWPRTLVQGPTVARSFAEHRDLISPLLQDAGLSASYYERTSRLPLTIAAAVPGLLASLEEADRVLGKGERHALPVRVQVDPELAWAIGMYVAEGYRREGQVVVPSTDRSQLDRLESVFALLGVTVRRGPGAVTAFSNLLSSVFSWIGTGGGAPTKRIPPAAFGWPEELLGALVEGLVGGDGAVAGDRTSVWTTSPGLVDDVLLAFARLGRRAGSTTEGTRTLPLTQVCARDREHNLPTISGGVAWDPVVDVIDTGQHERIYDIEVRPGGRRIENFLAGGGGIFVSNTAGFIDAGFDGHITLELSNVANLPITLYPGMKIGQISFLRMTTPADVPYGSGKLGSKYQGQRGPTPSRYWENFTDDERGPAR